MLVELQLVDLAVKRRSADPQPPRRFAHPSAVEVEGLLDHRAFDLDQPFDVSVLADEAVAMGFATVDG